MSKVFVLQHLHIQTDGCEDVKLIGIYSTRMSAEEAVRRLKNQSGFCDSPEIRNPLIDDEKNGFYIDEYELDKDHWETGFIVVD